MRNIYPIFTSLSHIFYTVLLTDWLTICREKPERELNARKWIVILFGCPWFYGILFGGLGLGHIIDPSDVPMSVYCWGSIAEPGTKAFFIASIASILGLITMTILVCCSMFALIKVRVFQFEDILHVCAILGLT